MGKKNNHNNLSISIIDPGNTDTSIRKIAMPGEGSKNLNKPVDVAKSITNEIFSDKIYKGEIIKVSNI